MVNVFDFGEGSVVYFNFGFLVLGLKYMILFLLGLEMLVIVIYLFFLRDIIKYCLRFLLNFDIYVKFM